MLAHQIVHRDVEQIGKLHQDTHIRNTVALLPFGDRLVRIVDLFGQLELRHIRHAPQAHDVFSDGSRKNILFHVSIIFILPCVVNKFAALYRE